MGTVINVDLAVWRSMLQLRSNIAEARAENNYTAKSKYKDVYNSFMEKIVNTGSEAA